MSQHSTCKAPAMLLSAEERERRKAEVDFARGSVRLEGIELSPEIEALNLRYIEGILTSEEHVDMVVAAAKRESAKSRHTL